MELRRLTTANDRRIFEHSLREARAKKGAKFREHSNSRISEIQLTFGRLYGLFNDQGGEPDQMVGGFCMHSLDEFGESFAVPEVTYELRNHAPHTVFEAGQLWSTDLDATLALRTGCIVILCVLRVQALLIYPVIIPRDTSSFYPRFRRLGAPFSVPFAETFAGEKIWLQAMILDGNELLSEVQLVAQSGFETHDMHSIIRFDSKGAVQKGPYLAACGPSSAPRNEDHNISIISEPASTNHVGVRERH